MLGRSHSKGISTMHFSHPSLRPTQIQPPTRLQQSPGERAFFQKLRTRMLKRVLWKIGAVLVYAVAIAVIALYGANIASPWWQAAAH
jgi:hypothetical protein